MLVLLGALLCPPASEAVYPGMNGKLVLEQTPPGAPGTEIATLNPDGSDLRQLTENSTGPGFSEAHVGPSWSPEGGRIVFHHLVVYYPNYPDTSLVDLNDSAIVVMNADGSGPYPAIRPGVGLSDPVFRPNGYELAFTCAVGFQPDGNSDVCVQNGHGASGPLDEHSPAYAADGRLFFVRNDGYDDEIWVKYVSGLELPLTSNAVDDLDPNPSPDGGRVAFSRWGSLFVMNSDGSDQISLTNHPPTGSVDPSFSPDGRKIAFVKDGVVYLIPVTGGVFQAVQGAGPTNQSLDWGAIPIPSKHLKCGGLRASQIGTNGSDTIVGTPRRDVLVGLGGNDRLKGRRGNDILCGGADRDRLVGGKGKKDKCIGGKGRDRGKGCEREKSV